MSANLIKTLTEALEKSGGWALSAVLMVAVIVLARHIKIMYKEHETSINDINKKLFEHMEKRLTTDIKYEQAFTNLKEIIGYLLDRKS